MQWYGYKDLATSIAVVSLSTKAQKLNPHENFLLFKQDKKKKLHTWCTKTS